MLAIPVGIVSLVIGSSSRLVHRRRQIAGNVIVAEYEPPDELSPAEVGYLFDSRLGKAELLATLLSLEQNSLVNISYSQIDGLKVAKTSVEPPPGLKEHEVYVMKKIASRAENFTIFSLRTQWGFNRQ